jgi:hypothetical protein
VRGARRIHAARRIDDFDFLSLAFSFPSRQSEGQGRRPAKEGSSLKCEAPAHVC